MPRPGQRRLIESPEVLYALFWDCQRRKVSEGGCVQLYGERYEPADGESLAKLFLEIERNVLVACVPANLGEAIALDLDGRFLGRLWAHKLISRGPVSHDDIRASMRIRRTAPQPIADYVTGLSRIRRSEIAHLQDRAEVPREQYSPPILIRNQAMRIHMAIGCRLALLEKATLPASSAVAEDCRFKFLNNQANPVKKIGHGDWLPASAKVTISALAGQEAHYSQHLLEWQLRRSVSGGIFATPEAPSHQRKSRASKPR